MDELSLPNINNFQEIHHNFIILTHIIKLPTNAKSRFDKDYKILKSFASDVVAEESRKEIKQQLKHVYYHCPLSNYNPKLYDSQLIASLNLSTEWYSNIPLSDCAFTRFEKIPSIGCQHYCSTCELECATCKEFYGCRYCHDDVCDHIFPKFETENVRCRKCSQIQPFSTSCNSCGEVFGKISCDKCKFLCFIDHNAKPFFHCDECGRCQCGFQEDYQHCTKCKLCIRKTEFKGHVCQSDCSACLGPIGDSFMAYMIPKCGHFIHTACRQEMLNQQIFSCPICRKSILSEEMSGYRFSFQTLLSSQKLHIERQQTSQYQCNDCGEKFDDFCNLRYNNCQTCNTYNCMVIGESYKEILYEENQIIDLFILFVNGLFGDNKFLDIDDFCKSNKINVEILKQILLIKELRFRVSECLTFKTLVKFIQDLIQDQNIE